MRTVQSKGRRLRRLILVAVIAGVAAVTGALIATAGPTVGHFTSGEGRNAYLAAYRESLAEGPEPDEVLDVRTDYGVVRIYGYGGADPAADPLVLLPGRASGAPMWASTIDTFLASRPVYVVDLLGEPGLSIADRPMTTSEDQADWLAQALEAIPGELHVVGHSIGGWTAMNLAIHRPRAAASITVIDPVNTFGDLSLEAIVRSIPASVPWLPRSWRDSFSSWTAGGAPVADEPVAEMIEAGMQHYALGVPAPSRFTDEELGGVGAPVLVIMAGDSVMHDSAASADVARVTLPDAVVEVYPGASHAVVSEEADRIAADVEQFLAGHLRD